MPVRVRTDVDCFECAVIARHLSPHRRGGPRETEPFDLLLTDIVMPEIDGIELARRASDPDLDLKIMFITGFVGVALNKEGHGPGDARVLSKPFHLRELVDKDCERIRLLQTREKCVNTTSRTENSEI
ncbi:MAG: response regulator [Pseudomonadota bacterium]